MVLNSEDQSDKERGFTHHYHSVFDLFCFETKSSSVAQASLTGVDVLTHLASECQEYRDHAPYLTNIDFLLFGEELWSASYRIIH